MAKRPTSGSIYKPKYRNKNGELVESSIWWLKYYQPGNPKPIRESTETDSWDEANRKLKRKNGDVVTGRYAGREPERSRLEQLFTDLLDDYRRNGRKRLGELRWLEWPQVDFENNQIRLNPGTTKNKKGRTLPIYGEMREWLLMQKSIRDAKFSNCRYVFFQEDGLPIGDFRKAWASAC